MGKIGRPILIVLSSLGLAGSALAQGNFVAHLDGASQVPPVDTLAQGQFVAKLRGGELSYKLIVANITNIFASHIHCGAVDVNGPIGVTLFSGSPVAVNGILAQGPILAPDPGNACGWVDLEDVIDALESGDTYVNVHTTQTPPGEIRGQVETAGGSRGALRRR
jgi:hypothetical protein